MKCLAGVPLQRLRHRSCVANSHLKRIFLPGPESVGCAAFISALWLAGWVRVLLLPSGDGCHMWPFSCCHSSFRAAAVAMWRRTVSATGSRPNQSPNLFSRDCRASRGCLVWFRMVETLIQSRVCDFSSCSVSVDFYSAAWLSCFHQFIHTNTEPVILWP